MRTYIARSDAYDLPVINELLASMRQEANDALPGRKRAGFMKGAAFSYQIDMHYKGETHEITVPLPSENGVVTTEDLAAAVQLFHEAHEMLHTFSNADEPPLFMNLRLEMVIETAKPRPQKFDHRGEDSSAAFRVKRPVYFAEAGGFIDHREMAGAL